MAKKSLRPNPEAPLLCAFVRAHGVRRHDVTLVEAFLRAPNAIQNTLTWLISTPLRVEKARGRPVHYLSPPNWSLTSRLEVGDRVPQGASRLGFCFKAYRAWQSGQIGDRSRQVAVPAELVRQAGTHSTIVMLQYHQMLSVYSFRIAEASPMTIGMYQIDGNKVKKLLPGSFKKERDVQRLLEDNLQVLFGIRFLATEFSTGDRHGGRMDTLGIDDTNAPVIIEYKLSENSNVINQALFYLDWLMDHKGDFELLVIKTLGVGIKVDWSSPRVLCVAESFNKYDRYAVAQMGRPIELIQYRLFENGILMLDVVGSGEPKPATKTAKLPVAAKAAEVSDALKKPEGDKTEPDDVPTYELDHHLKNGSDKVLKLFGELQEHLLGLGEDVVESPRKMYIGYRSIKNFACVEVRKNHLLCYVSVDPTAPEFQKAPFRDVREIGHWGTGDLEVRIESTEDLELAKQVTGHAYKLNAG